MDMPKKATKQTEENEIEKVNAFKETPLDDEDIECVDFDEDLTRLDFDEDIDDDY